MFVVLSPYNAKTLRHDLKYLELNLKCIDVKEKSNRVIKSFDFESKAFQILATYMSFSLFGLSADSILNETRRSKQGKSVTNTSIENT